MKIFIVGPSFKTQGGISSVLKLYKENYEKELNLSFIASYSGFGRLNDLMYFSMCILKVFFFCITQKNALFHIHTASKGSYLRKSIVAKICRAFGRRYIFHIHGAMFDKFIENSPHKKKEKIIKTLSAAGKVVVLSESWKRYFLKYLPEEKLEVVYNPTPFIVDDYSVRENSIPKALFMGRFGDRKGTFDLLEAVKNIDLKNFQLMLYGDGEVDRVGKIVSDEGLGDMVKVNGWVDHSKVAAIYDGADFLVLPSYAEGLPMSVLEAMGRGLPVISTDVGGIAEAVINGVNGFIISPGDINLLARRIQMLAGDRGLRNRMGCESLRLAKEKFSVESIGKQLKALYLSLEEGGINAKG